MHANCIQINNKREKEENKWTKVVVPIQRLQIKRILTRHWIHELDRLYNPQYVLNHRAQPMNIDLKTWTEREREIERKKHTNNYFSMPTTIPQAFISRNVN